MVKGTGEGGSQFILNAKIEGFLVPCQLLYFLIVLSF